MYILGYSGFTRSSAIGQGSRNPFGKTHQTFDSIFEFREGEVPFSYFPLGYFGHDGSAALLKDGKVIACASEERFTRLKFSLNLTGNTLLPRNAIDYCLRTAGIKINDVDAVAHYCKFTKGSITERTNLLRPFINSETADMIDNSYNEIYESMMSKETVVEQFASITGHTPEIFIPVRHHLAHAASAYFPSGFLHAIIFTIDGTGELESSVIAAGDNGKIIELRSVNLPASLGALYLIMTVYLGFKTLGDEYKVMGLASYGNPAVYRNIFDKIVILNSEGSYSNNLMLMQEFKEYLLTNLGPARDQSGSFEKRYADIAAALQECLNNTVLHVLKYEREKTNLEDLCMAGGVALNCTMNGKIAKSGLFRNIFVQPASSDEGCSAGAAYYAWSLLNSYNVETSAWDNVYFGPDYGEEEILFSLNEYKDSVCCEKRENISKSAAKEIAQGKVIGWFQGRMEFGPRALGNRSILADPSIPGMKDIINSKVKRRESFRPFAPSVLEEEADNYFDMCGLKNSPYMLFAFDVRADKRGLIPAVTHVDNSSRVQTVSKKSNPLFWNVINEFRKIKGIPVVLNTSFNVKNEPIVCSAKDAVKCFLSTNIDSLFIGDYMVIKK